VPFPGGGNDRLDAGEFNGPAEFGFGLRRIGVECGGIAGTTGCERVRHFLAGDFFDRANDFEHGGRCPCAQVVEITGAGFGQFIEDGDVRAAEVVDVDVVAEAGAVGCRVIGAENLQGRALAGGGVDGERDEMRLGIVIFADRAVLGCAGGVEIPEGGEAQAVGEGERLEQVFDVELGLAIRIDWRLGECFHHRHFFRNAVGRAG